ncbi:hypothetical protein GUJ93_ZPchr0010g9536 [Zizania palustris]|uniref:Uncharacterized protein n=1 Tax=Zizania palustris TaxID=103762 RepID=A0A8J6BH46_ZIZPA|nr:hypothetical protein GUJ93_ZPchr0010g9536 [Zizania palustris]
MLAGMQNRSSSPGRADLFGIFPRPGRTTPYGTARWISERAREREREKPRHRTPQRISRVATPPVTGFGERPKSVGAAPRRAAPPTPISRPPTTPLSDSSSSSARVRSHQSKLPPHPVLIESPPRPLLASRAPPTTSGRLLAVRRSGRRRNIERWSSLLQCSTQES